MRSPYTLEDPPPLEPPGVVMEATAWAVAADLWHGHRPDSLLGTECVRCRRRWPCPTWEVADGVLGDVCAAVPAAAARTGRRVPAREPAGPAPAAPTPVAHPVPAAQPPAVTPPAPARPSPRGRGTPDRKADPPRPAPESKRRRRHRADTDPADTEPAGLSEAQTDLLPRITAPPETPVLGSLPGH